MRRPALFLTVGRDIIAGVPENVAEFSEDSHLGVGALDNVSGLFHLRSCIGDGGSNSGFTESGEVVQIVAEIDGLLFFDPKVFLQQRIGLALSGLKGSDVQPPGNGGAPPWTLRWKWDGRPKPS